MKILFLLVLLAVNIFAEEPIIKSLHVFVNRDITGLPVLRMNSSDKLNIAFDVEAEHEPSFNISFKFCDANWEPYDNLLLEGIGENVYYNVNLERLPHTTQGAEYSALERFPKKNIEFSYSGKWMFFITDMFDEDIVYEWGKFYVVKNKVKLKSDIQNWRREGRISSNNANDRVLNLKTSFSIPNSLFPSLIQYVEIVKNLEIPQTIRIEKDSFEEYKNYEWDGRNNFVFIIRDLEPGNEYRQINTKDKNRYQYPKTKAHFGGIEYSRFYQHGKKDFNGGLKLMKRTNEYSDYLITTFEFKPHKDIYDDIFIVGSFTNWEVLPWYKLEQIDDLYTIDIELKRGTYDYQFVTGTISGDFVENIDWRIFEGNFWDTENVYSIFLYYKSPKFGEYDEIIGYEKIVR